MRLLCSMVVYNIKKFFSLPMVGSSGEMGTIMMIVERGLLMPHRVAAAAASATYYLIWCWDRYPEIGKMDESAVECLNVCCCVTGEGRTGSRGEGGLERIK